MINTNSYKSFLNSPYKSIKHTTYFDSYDYFFDEYRNREITFLEIGVLNGGSLFMWKDYFGPKARIIGIDLNPAAKKWEKYGFEIYIGNQADRDFWIEFKGKVPQVDLVLDDGGHTYEQQIITTECLLDLIKDNGLLVIEDTHTSYMRGFGPKKYSFMEYVKKRIDFINKRFGEFDGPLSEKRFWSIEVVESMVAFKKKIKPTNLKSKLIINDGKEDFAVDYRYRNNEVYKNIVKFFKFFNIPTESKIIKKIIQKLEKKITKKRFTVKKFF